MNLRQRWAVAVLAAMAIVVSDARAEIRAGKASLGGLVGVPFFLGDSDLKDGQKPRLLGQANFQYVFTPSWRLSTQFGFGWIGYKDATPAPYPVYDPDTGDSVLVRDDMLAKFQPISATLIRALKAQGKGWSPYVGGGVNLTRLEIVNKRLKIEDPATFDDYVFWSPGVHAVAGLEYVIPANTNVTFDWSGRWTQLLKRDEERFPSGFTGKHSYVNFNFGVNVYFWPIGYKPVETATAPAPEGGATPAPEAPVAPEAPAEPDTSNAPPTPKSSPPLGALVKPARPTGAPTPSVAPSTTPAPALALTPPPAHPGVRDAIDGDADEACPSTDLRPMLGVPTSPPHPAEEIREP